MKQVSSVVGFVLLVLFVDFVPLILAEDSHAARQAQSRMQLL
jgi:hypothetical protein